MNEQTDPSMRPAKAGKKNLVSLRLRNLARIAAILAAVASLGWLSSHYHTAWDWTSNTRNSLTPASRKLLDTLHGPIAVTAFVKNNRELHRAIEALVNRYRRYKPDLTLAFVDPATQPQRARQLDIPPAGELVIEYRGRQEKLQVLNEQSLTNALLRLAGNKDRWIAFLEGHGERSILRKANYDLSRFAGELRDRGMHPQSLDLAKTPVIPDNASVLVIAAPQTLLKPEEVKIIQDYVRRGGDLLWLGEPGGQLGLDPLARQLGIRFLPGVVLSTRSHNLGVRNPAFIVIDHYPADHPVTRGLVRTSLLPVAVGLEIQGTGRWHAAPFLESSAKSWAETGDLKGGAVRFDPGSADRAGPLDLGVSLTRPRPAAGGDTGQRQQRVVVTGDGDFLSNAFLGNGANLQLGLNIVQWLGHDDRFIAIKPWAAKDLDLKLTTATAAVIAFGFPFGLPTLLLTAGFLIRYRRRRRR